VEAYQFQMLYKKLCNGFHSCQFARKEITISNLWDKELTSPSKSVILQLIPDSYSGFGMTLTFDNVSLAAELCAIGTHFWREQYDQVVLVFNEFNNM